MRCDTNVKLQLIILLGNLDLAVIRHPDVGAQVRRLTNPASEGWRRRELGLVDDIK